MKPTKPLFLFGALGVLGLPVAAAPDVDTSQWKCSACPAPETGTSGSVDVGAGVVSARSAKFGDFNGLNRKGGYFIAGGDVRYRSEGGSYARLEGSDLGLDARRLAAEAGLEGVLAVKLGYSEFGHSVSDSGATPFLGAGSTVQTLPAGYPAAVTADMPLGTTLQPVRLGTQRKRYDLGAAFTGSESWSYRVALRHDVRDGTQRMAGSFFSNAAQLVAPVDQVTDQFEVSTGYTGRQGQVTLSYQGSIFRNGAESLTWSNPYLNGIIAANVGQLALAPDNQFHQWLGTASYEISPTVRVSAELSFGNMKQDSPFLASTLNTSLTTVALPSQSLHGQVDTLGASVRLSATPVDGLRLNASYTRDKRDNKTPSAVYALVSTDMFLGAPRANQPYSYTSDRYKVSGDYRLSKTFKASLGLDQDDRQRTLQEVRTTRETTLWTKVGAQALDNVGLSAKLSHAERRNSDYTAVAAIDPAENPLLRKYNLVGRNRDSAALRADITVSEGLSVGLDAATSLDRYKQSTLGLISGRSTLYGADLSAALSEQTQLHVFAQTEKIRSTQAGSQAYSVADWSARNADTVDLIGVGVQHAAMKGKLVLGADLAFTRSHSDVVVETGASNPLFPKATTSLDSLRLRATYQLRENLSVLGSYWFESYNTRDWRYDGVLASTVPNVLLLGEQAPHYTVNVLGVALRYRF